MLLVRSYRTFAPLPGKLRMLNVELRMLKLFLIFTFSILNSSFSIPPGGIFLWHYPHDRSHWALPSKFGLWGARTFLRHDR